MTIGLSLEKTMTGVSYPRHGLFLFFRLKMAGDDAVTQVTAKKSFWKVKKNKKNNAKGCHARHRHPATRTKTAPAPAPLRPALSRYEVKIILDGLTPRIFLFRRPLSVTHRKSNR